MKSSRLRQQKGMTLIGWMFVLGILAFFTLMVLKLAPIYLEHFNAKSALESLKNEPYITKKSKREIQLLMSRRFDINDIRRVKLKDALTITKRGGRTNLVLEYEVRIPLFGNLDAITHFHDELELIAN